MGGVCVIGSINRDLVVQVDRLPAPGETRLATDATTLPGGKGANQAVAAARDGVTVRFIGAVGDDDGAALLRASLTSDGVDVQHLATVPGSSGLAVVTVEDGGENTVLVVPGANAAVTPELVARAVDDGALDGCRVVLAQLEVPVESVTAGFTRARAIGATTVLNAAPAGPVPVPLLAATDLLVVNQTELATITGIDDVDGALERSASLVPSVVLTRGAAGATLVHGTDRVDLDGFEVDAVDTVGAGDAFCGVLAASLAAGRSLHDALGRANAAGALATTVRGARSSPTATMLDGLLSLRSDAARGGVSGSPQRGYSGP